MYYHRVLILVVMDDALALILFMTDIKVSLNVLILVVMDDALALTVTGYICKDAVLILVVMDDALARQERRHGYTRTAESLNPCCNG